MYADVVRHVQACEYCSTSKSKPALTRYSPGNVVSERPFQVVTMDFVIPLPMTRRGNKALLLLQDHFNKFLIVKAINDTSALEVGKAFEENIFRYFGDTSLIHHARDTRFMSEVIQTFAQIIQAKVKVHSQLSSTSKATRPKCEDNDTDGAVYVEDPLQTDWDDIVKEWVHAINNSRD